MALRKWRLTRGSTARSAAPAASEERALPGWFTRAQVVERYAARTRCDLTHIRFYEAFALFKVAVVLQQIFFRFYRGQTQDARFADFDKRVAGLADAALEVIHS